MKAKRKTKVGTGGVFPVVEGRPSGREGDTTGEENFVPVEMIARKPASMMQELFLAHEGKVERVFKDDAGRALFALIRGSDGKPKAQVSEELRDRMRRLVHQSMNDETKDLASALKRLEELPENAGSLIHGGELDALGRMSVSMIIENLQRGLAGSLRELRRLGEKVVESRLKDTTADRSYKNLHAELKRRINTAFGAVLDSALSPAKIKSDSLSFSVPWGLFGVPEPMNASLPAIIHARRFVEEEKRLPTKGEIRDTLEGEYKADISRWKRMNQKEKIADSTWSDIFKEAGLAGLKKKSGGATSAKKGRKR